MSRATSQQMTTSSLLAACLAGDEHTLSNLLQDACTRSAAIAFRTSSSEQTLLHIACERGHAVLATTLVDAGSDVIARTRSLHTPAMLAATHGHTDCLRALLRSGLSADTVLCSHRANAWSALMYAASNGFDACVHFILDSLGEGSSKAMVASDTNREGSTALHLAARNGHTDVVATLLDAGFAINARSRCGRTPLLAAAAGGHEGTVSLLLERGADPLLGDASGVTPLHECAQQGHVELVRLLLPLSIASTTTNVADVADIIGRSALHYAAVNGHAAVVAVLLGAGFAIDQPDDRGCTALYLAACGSHVDSMAVLLERGADPLSRSNLRGVFHAVILGPNPVQPLVLLARAVSAAAAVPSAIAAAAAVLSNRSIDAERPGLLQHVDEVVLLKEEDNMLSTRGSDAGLLLSTAAAEGGQRQHRLADDSVTKGHSLLRDQHRLPHSETKVLACVLSSLRDVNGKTPLELFRELHQDDATAVLETLCGVVEQ